MEGLHPDTNIQVAVDHIKTGGTNLVYYPNTLYSLNVALAYLGNLQYTIFDRVTQLPEASFQVGFSTARSINEVLHNPAHRIEIELLETEYPGNDTRPPTGKITPPCA